MSEEKPTYDVSAARAAIQAEAEARVKRAAERCSAILQEARVVIAAYPSFTPDGRLVIDIKYVPAEAAG